MNISQQLQQTENWSGLTAYERAKICCQLLTTLGLPIPSWMQIRQWIGKGSANDIHRAKQDFLLDRQTVKTQLIQQDDMPTALSGSLQDWWLQLKQAAEQDYFAEKQQWQQQHTELQEELAAAHLLIEQQQQQIVQLHAQRDAEHQQSQQRQQEIDLRDQALDVHTQHIQQLFGVIDAQQAASLAEQKQHEQQQVELRQGDQQALAAQLNTLADFHAFAAQQIDFSRQQQQRQQAQQQDELLARIEHLSAAQKQQYDGLRQYMLKQQLHIDRQTAKRGQNQRMRAMFRV
ncbi:MAG: DNA-binding protein [Moraxellaceae bacterium]